MRFLSMLAASAIVMLGCAFAPVASVYANQVVVCSASPVVVSSTQVGGSYQETLNSASTITGGACAIVVVPPTNGTCTSGAATDLPGITLVCSGSFVRHAGGCNPLVVGGCPTVSGPYSFANVFGPFPGTHIANDEIFTVELNQAVSIPFTPSPGHSVSFFMNQTYLPGVVQDVFSISTEPGLFNDGRANGSTVICAQGRNPNLTTSSNGTAGVGCVLQAGKQYWLNMVPGVVFNGVFQACNKLPCKIAVQEQYQN